MNSGSLEMSRQWAPAAAQAAATCLPWRRKGPAQDSTTHACAATASRKAWLDELATRMGTSGAGAGAADQRSAATTCSWLRPASMSERSGEADEHERAEDWGMGELAVEERRKKSCGARTQNRLARPHFALVPPTLLVSRSMDRIAYVHMCIDRAMCT